MPTTYAWQGVSYYLPEQTVSTVLDYVRAKMAPGSLLVFDCCSPLMLVENDKIPGIRYNIERLRKIGEPYIFGIEPRDMKSWLQDKGFQKIGVYYLDDLEMTYMHTRTLPKNMWYVVTAI